jgi:hypothetical protein
MGGTWPTSVRMKDRGPALCRRISSPARPFPEPDAPAIVAPAGLTAVAFVVRPSPSSADVARGDPIGEQIPEADQFMTAVIQLAPG